MDVRALKRVLSAASLATLLLSACGGGGGDELQAAGIDDLVLDLRYNGGGYLDIASELAYMIAGEAATGGRVFEQLLFNDHNPLQELPDTTTPFHDTTLGFDDSVAGGTPLPTLNLDRVYLLVGPGTCSASEAILNGLRGIGVEVVMIGDTTCGTPYGFYARDNCGLSYFPIEFAGENDQGQQVDPDGEVPSCYSPDDFSHALGDPDEGLFSVALAMRDGGICASTLAKADGAPAAKLLRSPLREYAWRLPPKR